MGKFALVQHQPPWKGVRGLFCSWWMQCIEEKCQTVKRLCLCVCLCPSNQTFEGLCANNNDNGNKDFSRDELQVWEFGNVLTGNLRMGKRIKSLFTDSETSCCVQWDFRATPKQPHQHLPWHGTCQICTKQKMRTLIFHHAIIKANTLLPQDCQA